MAEGHGHLTDFVFGSSSFNPNIVSFDSWSMSRAEIDSSHLGTTTAMSYIPKAIYEPGEATFTIQYDPADTVPLASAVETMTLQPAGSTSTSDTLAASGFIKSFDIGALDSDSMMQAQVGIKFTGPITGI